MEEKQENLLQNTMQEKTKYYGNRIWRDMSSLGKWLILAVVTGCIVGAASSLFSYVLKTVTNVREEHLWIFYLLPVSGLIIVFLYQKFGKDDGGPNQVFMTIRSKDDVPLKSAPLIFISTALTHLTGGSAGREGAVIQLGGSIGNQLGRMLPLDEEDRHVMVMCGMSAAFAALFGTPMAAAVFAMEVVSVGVMYYTALVPCIIASLIASGFAASMGINPEAFHVTSIPALTIESRNQNGYRGTLLCRTQYFVLHGTERDFRFLCEISEKRLCPRCRCQRCNYRDHKASRNHRLHGSRYRTDRTGD